MSPDRTRLRELFVAYPGRTATLSVLPVVLAGAQGLNAVVHDVASPAVGVFVLAMLTFAAVATRLSLAALHTERLESGLPER